MDERVAAEEHLRVIRSLMERATVYRAISAPTALLGGGLSVLTAGLLLAARRGESFLALTYPGAARHFIAVWLAVLALTLLANTFLIWRKAQREQSAFFTSGLRLALASALPALLIAAVLTALFCRDDETAESLGALVTVWVTCYGLALLATANFAPPSLRYLGWAFLLTGIACTLLMGRLFNSDPARNAIIAMALTFGAYHLIYGVACWPRKTDGA